MIYRWGVGGVNMNKNGILNLENVVSIYNTNKWGCIKFIWITVRFTVFPNEPSVPSVIFTLKY